MEPPLDKQTSPKQTSPRGGIWLLLILLVSVLVYAPSLENDFAMDDVLIGRSHYATGEPNPMVSELRPLGEYFSRHYWYKANPSNHLYRPITILSYALTYKLIGRHCEREALPQHAFNLILYLLAVLLVYHMARRLLVSVGACRIVALVFGLHALHSEVVATVVGRAELLSFCLGGLALLAYLRGAAETLKPQVLVLAAVAYFGSLCSKESAIAWAPLMVIFGLAAHWRSSSEDRLGPLLARHLTRTAATVAVPLIVFLWLRGQMIAGLPVEPWTSPVVAPFTELSFADRLLPAISIWGYGLFQTLLPFRLVCDYGVSVFPLDTGLLDPRFLIAALGLLIVFFSGLIGASRRPALFVATSVFLGFSFVTSNVLLPIGTIYGERLFFTPSLAMALWSGWLWSRIEAPAARGRLLLLLGCWLGACALIILQRNPVWKNDATLFEHELVKQPKSARLQLCVASLRTDAGRRPEALSYLTEALRLAPDYAKAWNNLGAHHLDLGKFEEAESALRQGLEAKHRGPIGDTAQLHANLGLVMVNTADIEQGLKEFEKSLELDPNLFRARDELLLHGRARLTLEGYEALLAESDEWLGQQETPPEIFALKLARYRALFVIDTGRVADGLARLKELLAQNPLDIESRHAYLKHGLGVVSEQEFEAILTEGEKLAAAEKVEDPVLIATRGYLAYNASDYEEAEKLFGRALLSLSDVRLILALGSCLEQQKKTEAASQLYMKMAADQEMPEAIRAEAKQRLEALRKK
ncbi:MAG: tetratricopeptide repeat protein [Planctomycetota bacterium]|nr:tetratricopeptide repeat protein [Planctomycetota bacterium]